MIDSDGVIYREVFLRTAHNYDMDQASLESGLSCDPVSLTVQSSVEECDINTIVRRFGLTGELPSDLKAPVSGDFVDVVDFHTALNAVRASEESFAALPASLRARFSNDPQVLMDFVADSSNADEARKLGFLKPLPEPINPVRVEVIPPVDRAIDKPARTSST